MKKSVRININKKHLDNGRYYIFLRAVEIGINKLLEKEGSINSFYFDTLKITKTRVFFSLTTKE